MSINKNTLQKMSSPELEKYVQPDSKFVPEAIIFAYEILQSRGREFSTEEMVRINSLISTQKTSTKIIIHPNHTKAANVMYLSGALAAAGMIWSYEILNSIIAIFVAVTTLAFIFGMGYLISKGTDWVKYLLLILFVLGLIGLPEIALNIKTNPVQSIIYFVQSVLQAYAIILLFKVPKENVE
jgi:hypothetical protein